jgi:hypothetical protein
MNQPVERENGRRPDATNHYPVTGLCCGKHFCPAVRAKYNFKPQPNEISLVCSSMLQEITLLHRDRRDALAPRSCAIKSPIEARSRSSNPGRHTLPWIASRSLSSGARSRDPLARNDGAGEADGVTGHQQSSSQSRALIVSENRSPPLHALAPTATCGARRREPPRNERPVRGDNRTGQAIWGAWGGWALAPNIAMGRNYRSHTLLVAEGLAHVQNRRRFF